MADRLVRLLVGVILGVLIARHLGPESFGQFSVASALALMLGGLAAFGTEGILVRELSVGKTNRTILLGSTIGLRLLLGTASYLAALAYARTTSGESGLAMGLVAILSAVVLFQSIDALDCWFQSRLQSRFTVMARSGAFALASLCKVWLLVNDADVNAFAYATLLEAALAALALGAVFHARGHKLSALTFDRNVAAMIVRESWPLAASSVFVVMTMQLDKILLAGLANAKTVGLYSVATQLSSIWYIVPVVLGISVAPGLSRHYANQDHAPYAPLPHIYRALSVLAISGAVLLTLLAPTLISLLYGRQFADAAPLFAIHIWTGVFVFHVSIRTRVLIAQRQQHLVTLMALLTLLASTVLNLTLIPGHGAMGAAAASLGAWMLGTLAFPLLWTPTRPSTAMFIRSILPWPLR